MAVQAWSFYNKAKKNMGAGSFTFASKTIDLHFIQSAGNFATFTISTLGSLTSEVASASGYTKAGKSLTNLTWSTGASAKQYALKATALVQSAVAGAISNIKAAVLVVRTGASAKDAANKLLCFASLTSTQFSVSSGNTLTITPNASGIFTLT